MRVTEQKKRETRQRILDTARKLFQSQGFENTTTRMIAAEAGLATSTMFNYFPSKEAVVVQLARGAFEKAKRDFTKHRRESAPIQEDLFALVAAQLRFLRPMRKYVRPLLDSSLSPVGSSDPAAAEMQANLSKEFVDILVAHGNDAPSPMTVAIFWALYVGVLTFWGRDKSPKQEDTLAMLDQSLQMFALWLDQRDQK